MRSVARTHIGRIRQSNQDALLVMPDVYPIYAVADGMGGHRGGDIASFMAIEGLKALYGLTPSLAAIDACYQRITRDIYLRQQAEDYLSGMGTTLTMLWEAPGSVLLGHVGDSRAYRFHKSALFQLSTDHNDAKFLRDHGVVGRKPRLTQYIGLDPEEMMIEPSYAKEKLQQGDRYLLCSDGLTDMLDNLTLCSILKNSATVQQGVEALMDAALERGGRDNITIILVEVEEVRA